MSDEAELIGGDARFDELMKRLRATGIGKAVSASEWQEVVDFLDDNLLTEERIQKEYDLGKNTGHNLAIQNVKDQIMEKAAEHFRRGEDEKAEFLRELSRGIKI